MTHPSIALGVSPRRMAGFTLAELLVVVAIVLVLVAIAVPVLAGTLGDSEEATCAANRRTAKVVLATAYSTASPAPSQEELETMLVDAVSSLTASNGGKNLCPAQGTYSLAGDAASGTIIVKCTVHGLTAEDELYNWINGNGWDRTADDKAKRGEYADKNGITSWTPVEGVDNKGNSKTYYIQFKTYAGVSSSAFLYAGTDPDPKSTNPWNTRYICDTTGDFTGNKGQWYELPKETNIGYGNDRDAQRLKELLSQEGVKKVDLVGNKFVAAS